MSPMVNGNCHEWRKGTCNRNKQVHACLCVHQRQARDSQGAHHCSNPHNPHASAVTERTHQAVHHATHMCGLVDSDDCDENFGFQGTPAAICQAVNNVVQLCHSSSNTNITVHIWTLCSTQHFLSSKLGMQQETQAEAHPSAPPTFMTTVTKTNANAPQNNEFAQNSGPC